MTRQEGLSVEEAYRVERSYPNPHFTGLGGLTIRVPEVCQVNLNLSTMLREVMGVLMYHYPQPPFPYESICLLGSCLYRHHEVVNTIEWTRKKWWLFGPEIKCHKKMVQRKVPSGVEIVAITREGKDKDKSIYSQQVSEAFDYDGMTTGGFPYDPNFMVSNQASGVRISTGEETDDLPLHISWRSVPQLMAGLEQGSEMSVNVVRYGLPIFGAARFREIFGGVTEPVRAPLHKMTWAWVSRPVGRGRIRTDLTGEVTEC